jgi:Mg2+-importing ATPase
VLDEPAQGAQGDLRQGFEDPEGGVGHEFLVLGEGVMEGRLIFNNTMKYVLMATSEFREHVSVAGASAFRTFLPTLPSQILLNNLLYNTGQLVIPTDRVDPEALARPAAWNR